MLRSPTPRVVAITPSVPRAPLVFPPLELDLVPAADSSASDALVVASQARTDDLIQTNRTWEHKCKRLREQVELEETRGKANMQTIQRKWDDSRKAMEAQLAEERKEWEAGCDSLMALHRIVELRLSAEISTTQILLLDERDATRNATLQTHQRDFKLRQFKIRESELEEKVADLEEALEEANAIGDAVERQIAEKAAGYGAEAKILQKGLAEVHHKLSKLENENRALRERNTKLADKGTLLARTTLQLDGARTEKADLGRQLEELKVDRADLKRQLEKRENLEVKGAEELTELRNTRTTLEIDVKSLEAKLKDTRNELADATSKHSGMDTGRAEAVVLEKELEAVKEQLELANTSVDKEKARIGRFKSALAQWQTALDDSKAEIEKLEEQNEQGNARIHELEEQLSHRKSPNETVHPVAGPSRPRAPPPPETDSEAEVAEMSMRFTPSPTPPPTESTLASKNSEPTIAPPVVAKPKPKSKVKTVVASPELPTKDKGNGRQVAEEVEEPTSQHVKKPPSKRKNQVPLDEGPVEDDVPPAKKATATKRKADAVESDVAPPARKRKKKGDAEADPDPEPTQTKSKATAGKVSASTAGFKKTKPKPVAKAAQPTKEEGDPVSPEDLRKKAKKKITLYNSSAGNASTAPIASKNISAFGDLGTGNPFDIPLQLEDAEPGAVPPPKLKRESVFRKKAS